MRKYYIIIRGIVEYISQKSKYQKWIEFNSANFANLDFSKSRFVFSDVFFVPEWQFVNSVAIQELCKINNCSAATFSSSPLKLIEKSVFNSYGSTNHFHVKLNNVRMVRRHRELYLYALSQIDSKQSLFDFTIEDVHVGIDIYESILRTGLPTVEINSFITWHNIYIGLEYFVFFEELLIENRIAAFVLSHENYIYMGIPSKLGFKYNVDSYFFNSREFVKYTRAYESYDRFKNFRNYFNLISNDEKLFGIEWAKAVLNRRLKGEVGAEMEYQLESAFTFEKVPTQILSNGKKNVVIATHEFYDNPHGFGGLLFIDFYEWLIYLGNKSNMKKYNWYVKPHRDVAASEIVQLRNICEMFPNLILLNKDYTFHQLRSEGVEFALTCYGTIGQELPLLDFKVINAGYNPHMAYNFNLHPQSLLEYSDILDNLEKINVKIDLNEIYECFYTYKRILYKYDFTVSNYSNISVDVNIYDEYVKIGTIFLSELQYELKQFLSSGSTYSFLLKISNN